MTQHGRHSDVVSIAATSAGGTGIITVPENATLKRLDFAEVDDDGTLIEVELTWTSSPSPLKFVPNRIKQLVATNGAGVSLGGSIPLNVQVKNATTVTIKLTSLANMTVIAGLRWD